MRRTGTVAIALLLAACGGAAPEAAGDAESSLQVDAVDGAAPRLIAQATGLGLTALDGGGRVVPGLAQSWRVADDGLSILFRLRPSTADRPLPRPADAARAIEAVRRDPRHPFHALLGGVTAVAAPADDVVELRLSTPQPELLELLAQPELAVARGKAGRSGPGAFRVSMAPPASGPAGATRLLRNDAATPAADAPAAITVRAMPPAEALARFVRGDSDLVMGGRLDGLAEAQASLAAGALRMAPVRGALLLLVDARRAPLADAGVRRALALAIDRAAIGPALFGSASSAGASVGAAALYGVTPAGIEAFPAIEPADDDLPMVARQERARRMMAAAGHDAARPLDIHLALPDLPAMRPLAMRLAADWSPIGVRLMVETRAPAAHAALLRRGGYQLALDARETPYGSPLPLLLPLRCGASPGGVCVPAADRQLAVAWTARSVAERATRYAEAERLWLEAGSVIPLTQPVGWALVSDRVRGWTDNPAGVQPLDRLSRAPARRLFR